MTHSAAAAAAAAVVAGLHAAAVTQPQLCRCAALHVLQPRRSDVQQPAAAWLHALSHGVAAAGLRPVGRTYSSPPLPCEAKTLTQPSPAMQQPRQKWQHLLCCPPERLQWLPDQAPAHWRQRQLVRRTSSPPVCSMSAVAEAAWTWVKLSEQFKFIFPTLV